MEILEGTHDRPLVKSADEPAVNGTRPTTPASARPGTSAPVGSGTTVRDALTRYYDERGLLGPGETVDERLRARWVYMRILGRRVPIKPLLGHQDAFLLHDIHHMLAGYGTTYREELEEAAWELGSGGCGRWILFWNNRILAILQGLILCPRRTLRALKKGFAERNLYRLRARDVLACDLEDIQAHVHPQPGPATARA